jgi:hypothetical protein
VLEVTGQPPDAAGVPADEGIAEPLRQRVLQLQAALEPQHQRALAAHARAARLADTAARLPAASADIGGDLPMAHEALAAAIRGAGLTGEDFLTGTEAETLRLALPLFDRVLVDARPIDRAAPVPAPTIPPRRHVAWRLAAIAAAAGLVAAGVLLTRPPPPASNALQPELMTAPDMTAPTSSDPSRPLPPWPEKLELTATIEAGQLKLTAPRQSGDAFVAVALIDARSQKWLARPGDDRDLSCKPDCGPLELHVALDGLAPGSFRVMVMVSEEPITRRGVWQWLPQADQVAPRWLFVRAYAVRRLEH